MSNLQDDVRKFILEIEESKNNGETLAQLTKLQKETAKYRQENEELQKVMAHLDAKGQRNSKTYKEMEAKLKANKTAIRQNGVAMKGLEKNIDLVYMSSGQLKKRAMELRSALSATSKAANPEEYNRLETELKQVGKQMDVLKGKSNQTQGFLGKMKGAAAGIMPALGPAALVAGAGAAAKKIFDLSKQTMDYRQQMQKLTGESGQQLADLTAKVDASAKTFQKDFSELAIANHNFAESMGLSEQASQKLIDKGFLAGADASGEFLDRLREYGPQFKAAGISAEQAIAIMTQETKSGIYSDKGTDAIKEATIAIREMTPVTRAAIDGIGLSSKKLEQDLRSGAISYFDAIQIISNKMSELPPQSTEVGAALADIFKGAGEDAGLEYIKMLGTVESSMDKMVEGAGETAAVQMKLLEANTLLTKSWSDLIGAGTGWFTALEAGFKYTLAGVIHNLLFKFRQFKADGSAAVDTISGKVLNLADRFKMLGKVIAKAVTLNWDEIPEVIDQTNTKIEQRNIETAQRISDAYAKVWEPYIKASNEANQDTSSTNAVETKITGNYHSNGIQEALAAATAANKNYKKAVLEDASFIDKEIEESYKNQTAAMTRAANEAMRTSKELTDFEKQQIQEREEDMMSWAMSIGKTFGDLLSDSEANFSDYLRATILLALDALHQYLIIEQAKLMITEALAVATGKFWAVAKAVAGIAAMEAAYQGARGVISKSLYDGGFAGYTGDGGKYDKKQLVQLHGSEYVVPIEGTHNPSVKQVLDIIETARRNGTLSSMNLPAAVSANAGGSSTQLVVLDATDFDKAVTRLENLKIPFSYNKFAKLEEEYKRQQQGSGI